MFRANAHTPIFVQLRLTELEDIHIVVTIDVARIF